MVRLILPLRLRTQLLLGTGRCVRLDVVQEGALDLRLEMRCRHSLVHLGTRRVIQGMHPRGLTLSVARTIAKLGSILGSVDLLPSNSHVTCRLYQLARVF